MCNKFKNNLKFEKSLNISEIIKDGIYYVTYFFSIIFSFYINIDIIDIITYLNIEVILLDNLKSFLNDLPLFTYQKNIFIKISEFFSIEEEKDNKLIYNLENDITLKNVSFSYNNKEVFKYNFHINKNEHIMIKGKNGCGKSTLCKILTGMINEYDGKVLLNEKNILDLEPNFLRTIISFSDQKAQLFNDTIKNNITLGIEYDNKLFEKVCNICELETIVEKKTNRYNSIIYEGCPNLSGGEIQKIILARTLIRKSKIIILDETLSEVNIESEIEIIKKINKELKNKTIIYITHKNLEKYFDKIIHLN